ncbi:anhydro-N-acetylmuramic acid kinase [Lentiprolixibacter aurantiacus]|uniref:Anhydro-N-acetylmuramic acid kinase n=1 Tax=Lentiprolixibacter aurantiacus TaxID=2993939 RepID=A0AAE3MM95_9FLAO|nr:anhydro-N-acetylmuramic acid kinase [Lentiprolixibacter aurantiacus]MCX2720395.1 anhydro-N-acetylmuramic acid kinase [Lentiprolixibacter aurantiacus]
MKKHKVLALMSGTSLDGLDMAYCHFAKSDSRWTFEIKKTRQVAYERERREVLKLAITLPALEHTCLHNEYGTWLGQQVRSFIAEEGLDVDFVSSHGHTSHHQPHKGVSWQLGSGQHLANACGLQTVCDFRSNDVALGGQGAPLVPIGDQELFGDYTFCLNLGGISNISLHHKGKRIAYDIGVANMMLNHICQKSGFLFDEGGALAAKGTINEPLLDALNNVEYYRLPFPKSTGYEWFLNDLVPLLEQYPDSLENQLCTAVEHITSQVADQVRIFGQNKGRTLLVTGGGAHNKFLIGQLSEKLSGNAEVVVPDATLVDYKEALVFGLMGVMRMENEINILSSVTGAERDSTGGVIYYPA